MSDHRPHPHDDREIDVATILKFGGGLTVLCAIALGAAWWLDDALFDAAKKRHPEPIVASTARPKGPEGPRLQARAPQGLADLRAEEEQQLHGYRWLDRDEGRVQIPIARAMELVAKQGLPVRDQAPEAEPLVSIPSESGLGQVTEPRPPKVAPPEEEPR